MKRQLPRKEAAGMTVNERLWVSGLWEDFEKAVAERNRQVLRAILEQVHLDAESADAVIQQLLEE